MLEGGAGFYDEGSTRVPSGLCQRSGFRAQNFEVGWGSRCRETASKAFYLRSITHIDQPCCLKGLLIRGQVY